jgi:hypothetical protein
MYIYSYPINRFTDAVEIPYCAMLHCRGIRLAPFIHSILCFAERSFTKRIQVTLIAFKERDWKL